MSADSMTLREIPLAGINISNFTYSVWAWSDYSKVQSSMALAGLLEPPILVAMEGGFAIVSGQKRVRAALDLGWDKIPAVVKPQPDEICQLFINTVMGNLSFRDYNMVEKSLILNKLQALPPCGHSIEKILAALGLNHSNINNIKALAGIPQEALRAVACGKVRPGAALEFMELGTKGQAEFIKALEIVDLGENKQKEVVRLLLDLAKIHHCGPEEILQGEEVARILRSPVLNAPQKGTQLREILHRKRLPMLSQMEAEFETAKARIRIPPNVRILNASPFEADTLNLSVSIASEKDLQSARQFLDEVGQKKNFDPLLRAATGLSEGNPE